MKALLVLLALCTILPDRCFAEDRLIGDIYTHHSSDCQDAYAKVCAPWLQPKRLSWQHDLGSDFSTDVGVGSNSYGKLSLNIGGMWQPVHIGPVSAGMFATLVSGYTCEQLKTCVLVAGLAASYEWQKAVLQVLYVPAVGGGTVSVVQLRAGLAF